MFDSILTSTIQKKQHIKIVFFGSVFDFLLEQFLFLSMIDIFNRTGNNN